MATLLPLRLAASLSGELAATRMAVPKASERLTAKALTRLPAASEKSSGASPMGPKSTASAFKASASGAAAGNSAHLMS